MGSGVDDGRGDATGAACAFAVDIAVGAFARVDDGMRVRVIVGVDVGIGVGVSVDVGDSTARANFVGADVTVRSRTSVGVSVAHAIDTKTNIPYVVSSRQYRTLFTAHCPLFTKFLTTFSSLWSSRADDQGRNLSHWSNGMRAVDLG